MEVIWWWTGSGDRIWRFMDAGKYCRSPGLFYADDLVLCSEWEKDLRAIVERFVEVCRRRGQNINADKGKFWC